jgi:lysophospholipase L1-like esterase
VSGDVASQNLHRFHYHATFLKTLSATYDVTHEVKKTKDGHTKLVAVVVAVIVFSAGLAYLILSYSNSNARVRVACLGDSITEVTGYPADLQVLLGNACDVRKFGVVGATILLNTDRPYLNQTACSEAEAFQPQVVVIMLGTNDARTNIYPNSENLEANFGMLVAAFQALKSHPKILVATPPPVFNNTLSLSSSNLVQGVIPRVEQEAKALNVTTVDVYDPLLNHPEYFPDGVHPNLAGAEKIAQIIFAAIVNEES